MRVEWNDPSWIQKRNDVAIGVTTIPELYWLASAERNNTKDFGSIYEFDKESIPNDCYKEIPLEKSIANCIMKSLADLVPIADCNMTFAN